ncbi:hypothetical protein MYX77_00985 [Acidobacteriia bacterium AH_259_A11_L15]|nr:hypothetical protein [Acidobacteriia bacterium AH_259_A11_L15]
MTDEKDPENLFGPVIYSYTTEQAVEDGILVHTGTVGPHKVYFARTLFDEGYEDLQKRVDLVNTGLELLRQPDPEDTPYMKLRVLRKDKIWVVAEPGKLTYMKPEDY